MATGVVVTVRIDRGFFFIRNDDGTGDIFAHCSNMVGNSLIFDESLKGQRVAFDIVTRIDGRLNASNIRAANDSTPGRERVGYPSDRIAPPAEDDDRPRRRPQESSRVREWDRDDD